MQHGTTWADLRQWMALRHPRAFNICLRAARELERPPALLGRGGAPYADGAARVMTPPVPPIEAVLTAPLPPPTATATSVATAPTHRHSNLRRQRPPPPTQQESPRGMHRCSGHSRQLDALSNHNTRTIPDRCSWMDRCRSEGWSVNIIKFHTQEAKFEKEQLAQHEDTRAGLNVHATRKVS